MKGKIIMEKKNRFYENRKAIQILGKERGVNIDVASTMYAQEQGWTGWQKEMDEWKAIQNSYVQSPTKQLADLFK